MQLLNDLQIETFIVLEKSKKLICKEFVLQLEHKFKLHTVPEEVLGTCGRYEEISIGVERFNILKDCSKNKTVTIVLRGGGTQFIEEAGRSLNDAIEVVRRARKHSQFVPGGGSIEMELSKHLRDYSRSIEGKNN